MADPKYDLEDRFVEFAVGIIRLSRELPETKAGKHVCTQLLRSGTSPAPNYGEAQSAESRADFIHKLKVALKELRETQIWLKIIVRSQLLEPPSCANRLRREANELISILFASIRTARENQNKRNNRE